MSGPIQIEHHAVLRHVPRRGRHPRRSWLTVSTPVRLHEVNAREMVAAGTFEGLPVHLHDGHLWRLDGRVRALPSPLDYVANAARANVAGATGYDPFLRIRSPLVPSVPGCLGGWHPSPAGTRHSVVHDGTDRARLDLVEYLDRNVRVVEGLPFVRLRGPLVRMDAYADPTEPSMRAWVEAKAGEIAAFPRLGLSDDALADALSFRFGERDPGPRGRVADVTPLSDGRDDILHFLNLIGMTLMSLDWGEALRKDPEGYVRPRHEGVMRRMTPWAELGMTGSVHLDDASAVLADARLSCDAAMEAIEEEGHDAPAILSSLAAFMDDYVEPGLSVDLSPDDEAALGHLAIPGH